MSGQKFRLAVCSSGAVALGAFEAGVLSQLYADTFELRGGAFDVNIDVVAGASAGAVTGVILTQAIAATEPPTSLTARMQALWVQGLSLTKLLGSTANQSNSLFDPASIDSLASHTILDDATMRKNGGSSAPVKVTLSIAITNLDGIPIRLPNAYRLQSAYYSLFADYETLAIRGGVPHSLGPVEQLSKGPISQRPSSWNAVKELAIASSAFPFAFQSRALVRDLQNYPDSVNPRLSQKQTFNYSDGGLLDNNPIGRAIDAAAYQERLEKLEAVERYFVVVEPDPVTEESAQNSYEQGAHSPNGLPPLELAGKVTDTYFTNALSRDLLKALRVNEQLRQLNKLVEGGTMSKALEKEVRVAMGLDFKRLVNLERIVPLHHDMPLEGAFGAHFGGFLDKAYRAYDFAAGCSAARVWVNDWLAHVGSSQFALSSELQAQPVARAPQLKQQFAGIDVAALSKEKSLLSNRAVALIRNHLQAHGLLGFVADIVLRWVHGLVGKYLNRTMR